MCQSPRGQKPPLSPVHLQGGFDWSTANATTAWATLGQFITYNPGTGAWLDWSNTGLYYRSVGEELIGLESWQQNPTQGTGHLTANAVLLAIPGGLLGKLISKTRHTHHHNNAATDTETTGKNNDPGESQTPSNENKAAEFGTAPRKDYRKTFIAAHPELDPTTIEVHHAIEQGVLKKYPGLITEKELHSLENLRGIPTTPEGNTLHRTQIRDLWRDFYVNFEKLGRAPTKEELLDYATYVDDLVGDQFLPPVR